MTIAVANARTYQGSDAEISDYQLFRLPLSPLHFRGPAPGYGRRPKIVILGAAQSFGRFVQKPYLNILGDDLGVDVLNLSYAGAGPDFYLKRPELIHHANRADACIVQVMSARSVDTFLYRVVREANVRRVAELPVGRPRGADQVIDWYVKTYGEDEARLLLDDMRSRYLAAAIALLEAIRVPKILLWFAQRTPDYEPGFGSQWAMLGGFPQGVDRALVRAMAEQVDGYCECVTARGSPQLLVDHEGSIAWANLGGRRTCLNSYYPSPEMHVDAAAALVPMLKDLGVVASA